MHLPLSRSVAQHITVLPEIGSTNAELVARAAAGTMPDFTVLVTGTQTAGRGRLGRSWVAPPGTMLAVSVLLRPPALQLQRAGWLPLLAGLAMTRAVESLVAGHEVALKWPNDVQVDGLKVSGILTELLPSGDAVVVGAGLNLTMAADELPVPTATSLVLNGAAPAELPDRALSGYLRELKALYDSFSAAGMDAVSSGLQQAVSRACGTIGRRVRVELPDGTDVYGTAEAIDGSGRLIVRGSGTAPLAVAAGDVTHLRYE